MQLSQEIAKFKNLLDKSQQVLVLQPEKPDGDSLASSLALEDLLSEAGKRVTMYSKDGVPEYIRMLEGWDRVTDEFPSQFDLTILVDAGGPQMLARTLEKYGKQLQSKPFIIIDHHASREPMPFLVAAELVDPEAAAAGELIYFLAAELDWKITPAAAQALAAAIIYDTQNLTLSNVTVQTLTVLTDCVKHGASLVQIHDWRRSADALTVDLFKYRAALMQRAEWLCDDRLAVVTVPPAEMKQYAELHDPADLVIYALLHVKGIQVVAVLRDYGTKIKGSIRALAEVAAPAARHFGGGGHPKAAGFRVEGKPVDEVKDELVKVLSELLRSDLKETEAKAAIRSDLSGGSA